MKHLSALFKICLFTLPLFFLPNFKVNAATCGSGECQPGDELHEVCGGGTVCCYRAAVGCPSWACSAADTACKNYRAIVSPSIPYNNSPWSWVSGGARSTCRSGAATIETCWNAGCYLCTGAGGGGGTPPPTPVGTVFGTLYVNDGLTENGSNHSIGPDTATTCTIYSQPNAQVSEGGGPIVDSWGCTSLGTKWMTNKTWTEGSKPTLTITGFDTNKFECDIWYYKICHDDACTINDVNQGSGCTVTFAHGLEDGYKNILNFRLKPKITAVFWKKPPVLIPTNRPYTFEGYGYVWSAGTYSGGAKLSWLRMYLKSITLASAWAPLGNTYQVNCSDTRCNGTTTWDLTGYDRQDGEHLVLAINAATATTPPYYCTGNPFDLAGMWDCDTDHTDDAYYVDSTYSCLFNCPYSAGGVRDQITLTSPINTQTISTSTTAQLVWPTINFGNYTYNCATAAVIGQRVTTAVLYWGTSPASLTNAVDVTGISSTGLPANYTLSGLTPNTTYYWKIEARNVRNNVDGTPAFPNCSNSSIWSFKTTPEQPTSGWITGVDGDVYASQIDMAGPASGAVVPAPWAPAAIAKTLTYGSSMFAGYGAAVFPAPPSNTLKFTDPSSNLSGNNTKFKDLSSSTPTWLDSLANLTPPTPNGTTVISLVNNNFTSDSTQLISLDPTKSYVLSKSVKQYIDSGCGGGCQYDLSSSGVVLIYYSSDEAVNISNTFRSKTGEPSKRIMFISKNDFNIANTLFTPNPAVDRPTLEIGIITAGTINFPGTSPAGSDKTIKVEGPLIARHVNFSRVTQFNATPGVAVMYKPIYLSKISSLGKTASIYNFPNMFFGETIWVGAN